MPQEHSPERPTSLESQQEDPTPRLDQPVGGVPTFAEGTTPPPYPSVIGPQDITEGHVTTATQELLSYIGSMRQRAEQRANRSRTHNVSPPERKPESDSARADLRNEELGPTSRILPPRSLQTHRRRGSSSS